MKKQLTINVGLNNNNFDQKTILAYFERLYTWSGAYKLLKYTFEVGEWQGQKEITFVGLFEYSYSNASKVLTDFEKIASVMNQQAIAIKCEGLQAIAYNISAKNKTQVFNENYFYNIVKQPKTKNDEQRNKRNVKQP
jgi:hypothetical protein